MAERTQKPKQASERSERDPGLVEPASHATGERLKGELDDLLDEIDSVLETNAEEFVRSYVQKGGQ